MQTEAAKTLVTLRGKRFPREVFYRAVQSEVKRIARLCNEDTHEGYYGEE
jgi:hypothetical protein